VGLREELLLGVKDGRLELTIELLEATEVDPETIADEIRARIQDHTEQLMTDPTLLDPPSVRAVSCLISRDPIPEALGAKLAHFGLDQVDGITAGGAKPAGVFGRLRGNKRSRTHLEKWSYAHARAEDVDPKLAAFESALVDEVPDAPWQAWASDAAEIAIEAAATHLELVVEADSDGLAAIEPRLLAGRDRARGRLVLHPSAVRGVAAFVGAAIRTNAPDTQWTDDEDAPLYVNIRGGLTVRTDPGLRVVRLLGRGKTALLSDYAQAVVRQSLTGAQQA